MSANKPCPFCGSDGFLKRICTSNGIVYTMQCEMCRAQTKTFRVDEDTPDEIKRAEAKAINAWNRRDAE